MKNVKPFQAIFDKINKLNASESNEQEETKQENGLQSAEYVPQVNYTDYSEDNTFITAQDGSSQP